MLLLYYKLVFLAIVTLSTQNERCKNKYERSKLKFYGARNRVLKNYTFETKYLSHYAICGRDCAMEKKCKSFNFHNHLCELNKFTWTQHLEDYYEDQGSLYFDQNEDTPLSSLNDYISSAQGKRSCKMLLNHGYNESGVYTIFPDGFNNGLQVYCDMTTDGGGWIVFQHRQDGTVDFYRNWTDYRFGFGDKNCEFWLGNDNLALLTTAPTSFTAWELRVDLTGWKSDTVFAKYGDFKISGEKYNLFLGQYDPNSTAGDALSFHNGQSFSTKDNDNDKTSLAHCAEFYEGAWWFTTCLNSHLNGLYYHDGKAHQGKGIMWQTWNGYYTIKTATMKIRENDF